MCECSMEDLVQTLKDTVIAINTGILRDRKGKVVKKSEGKSTIQNAEVGGE